MIASILVYGCFSVACYLGYLLKETGTHKPLYNTVCYGTIFGYILDTGDFEMEPQNVWMIYKNDHKWSVFYIYTFFVLDATRLFNYSKIPILRPPLGLSKSGLKDHLCHKGGL